MLHLPAEFIQRLDMPEAFAVGVVVIVRAEPVDEIAFGDHVLLQQRRSFFSSSLPYSYQPFGAE